MNSRGRLSGPCRSVVKKKGRGGATPCSFDPLRRPETSRSYCWLNAAAPKLLNQRPRRIRTVFAGKLRHKLGVSFYWIKCCSFHAASVVRGSIGRHSEKVTAYEQQRAQNRNAKSMRFVKGKGFTAKDIPAQHARQHGKCCWCAQPLTDEPYPDPMSTSIEHLHPISSDRPSNRPEDLALAHLRCNQRRKNKSVDDFVSDLLGPTVLKKLATK